MSVAQQLASVWCDRLRSEFPQQSTATINSIVCWLLGEDPSRLETLEPRELAVIEQGIEYRYRVLGSRYLGKTPEQAYKNLITRLGSLVLLRNKIKTWVSLSRDRQRAVTDVLQEVIQEMLNSDRHIHRQISWISQSTGDKRLRNALLLTSVEEYCLRPIRNQPLLVFRFVNYLRRIQRGGMTHVPEDSLIRLVSEEVMTDESEGSLSLLDTQALNKYQEDQNWEEQSSLRISVQREFELYLQQNVGEEAARWLQLYLQGRSQEDIARILSLPSKQVYRLREKVSYHAVRVFALKEKPELVTRWLEISLGENNLGLTPKQWEHFYGGLNPTQQVILMRLKAGSTVEEIAKEIQLKTNQVFSEWTKLYLAAQSLRVESNS